MIVVEKSAAEVPVEEYVDYINDYNSKKGDLLAKDDADVKQEYDDLKGSEKVTCDDVPDKETMAERILSVKEGFEFRNVKLTPDILKTMESDWVYSSQEDKEIFRMLCLDPKTEKVKITTDSTRVEGDKGAGSVQIDLDLCEKAFPTEDLIPIGGFHTHPSFMDRPLESLGDVMSFASMGEENFACVATGWGINCMFRKKEPAFMYDVPRTKEIGGGRRVPVHDDTTGKIIYEVKSDVVDWDRAKTLAATGYSSGVVLSSAGRGKFGELARLPWFTPEGKPSRSVGVVEEIFDLGRAKSKPMRTKDLYCETFYDWFEGEEGKTRTVCNNGYYVEAPSNPIMWMFERGSMSSNFYHDIFLDVAVKKERFSKPWEAKSKYWNDIRPKEEGFYTSAGQQTTKTFGFAPVNSTVVSAASIKVDGDADCELLLNTTKGTPRAIFCRKSVPRATENACVML